VVAFKHDDAAALVARRNEVACFVEFHRRHHVLFRHWQKKERRKKIIFCRFFFFFPFSLASLAFSRRLLSHSRISAFTACVRATFRVSLTFACLSSVAKHLAESPVQRAH
jgi:hypothetical protein